MNNLMLKDVGSGQLVADEKKIVFYVKTTQLAVCRGVGEEYGALGELRVVARKGCDKIYSLPAQRYL